MTSGSGFGDRGEIADLRRDGDQRHGEQRAKPQLLRQHQHHWDEHEVFRDQAKKCAAGRQRKHQQRREQIDVAAGARQQPFHSCVQGAGRAQHAEHAAQEHDHEDQPGRLRHAGGNRRRERAQIGGVGFARRAAMRPQQRLQRILLGDFMVGSGEHVSVRRPLELAGRDQPT
jgi:hypothetical protein